MELVETCSKNLKTISWIWGGLTIDIYENRILREHDDLDYLTLNLHSLIPQFSDLFAISGWQVNVLENGDLKVKQECVKIQLGHVELSNEARWTHDGEKGSIWFPSDWIKSRSVNFCGIEIHVIEPEFQFVMPPWCSLVSSCSVWRISCQNPSVSPPRSSHPPHAPGRPGYPPLPAGKWLCPCGCQSAPHAADR
jgi:hypothetical protein